MRDWAFYNEIDDYAADWIENLIRLGVVAPGIVDRRSIEDVRPDDLRGFRQCHFFAGIAIWSYALRRAGVQDDAAVWTGSCPCQPFSAAGQAGGVDDERHLWPAFFHLIANCRPPRIYGEQVASKDGLGWLDLVQADLEGADYSIWAVDTCSAGAGAPHIRQRLRFCADDLRSSTGGIQHASGNGWLQRRAEPRQWGAISRRGADRLAFANCGQCDGLTDGEGCQSDRQTSEWVEGDSEPECYRSVEQLADADDTRLEGWERVPERADQCSAGSIGLVGKLADTDGRDTSAERQQRSGEQRQQPQDGGTGDRTAPNRPGPTNGFWRDADWLFCRDGKWRPTQPFAQPLVDGNTFRVGSGSPFEGKSRQGMLKGYGNAIDAEATVDFIEATIDPVDDMGDLAVAELLR